MAFSAWTYGVLVASALLCWYIADFIRVARFKKLHHCEPEVLMPQSERIIGYGLYKIQIQASHDRTILEIARKRYLNYGNTWSARMMGKKFFNTIEPENIKYILATNFKDFVIGERQEAWGPLLGQGIFTTDGAQWEHSRTLIRPNFTRAQVANLITFETHIQALISRLPRDGSTIDLQPLFFNLTLDSATEVLFGASVHSLSSIPGSEQDAFGCCFDLAQGRLANRSRMGKLVQFYRDPEFDEACRTVHAFVDRIVERALERRMLLDNDLEKSIAGKSEERYVFLDELTKSTQDPKQLRDELLNILLAGRDTTASLLSNTFHVLARRPDIWAKLKAEVSTLHGVKPDYETLRNMKYLKYILNESLRLYPVVPTNARFAARDTILPLGGGVDGLSPIYIRKGSVVAYSLHAMHRRRDIYGEDADEFRPERWGLPCTTGRLFSQTERAEYIEGGERAAPLRPGWGYLPFNGGPRICVGQQFALTEASYAIVRLVQEFQGGIEERDNGREWVEQLSLTVCSARGVKVGLFVS